MMARSFSLGVTPVLATELRYWRLLKKLLLAPPNVIVLSAVDVLFSFAVFKRLLLSN